MQQAPSFLALSIRTAFKTSKAVNRPAFSRCIPAYHVAARQWPKDDLRLRRLFHSTRVVRIDESSSKSELSQSKPESSETSQAQPAIELPPLEEASTSSATSAPGESASHSENHTAEPLPSHTESRRSPLSKRFTHLMDTLQSNVFVASQHINDLTGYSGIEALKRSIEEQENDVQRTRAAVKTARDDYMNAVSIRSSSQREVNDLLQRKHAWSPTDLERFTSLYRSDHVNEQAEAKAQDEVSRAEREAEEAAGKLAKTILARYHEEQIWSDKIRRMSTWGTWGLMGLNVFLFLVFQIAVEPWRRRRLVRGFEEKVMEALEKETVVNGHSAAPMPIATVANTTDAIPGTLQSSPEQEAVTAFAEPADIEPAPMTPTTTLTESPPPSSSPLDPLLATTEQIQQDPIPLHDLSNIPSSSAPPPSPKATPLTNIHHTLTSVIPSSILSTYITLAHHFSSLFSRDVTLSITQRDLTGKVVEGALGGAAVAWIAAVVLLRGR